MKSTPSNLVKPWRLDNMKLGEDSSVRVLPRAITLPVGVEGSPGGEKGVGASRLDEHPAMVVKDDPQEAHGRLVMYGEYFHPGEGGQVPGFETGVGLDSVLGSHGWSSFRSFLG